MNSVSLPFSSELTEYSDDHFLYLEGNHRRTWQTFCALVRQWDTVFGCIAESKVAVFHQHGGEFLALVCAAWRAGKTVIVPPNVLPATVTRLLEQTPVLVGEFGERAYQVNTKPQSAQSENTPRASERDRHQNALILYTSGSTGEPVQISKTFAQINAEIELLDQLWGQNIADALFVASVPHHHLFGLTFKLFWPLLTGKSFLASEVQYFERLPELAQQAKLALVCSPTHLATIPPSVD
ncbi:MAG: AMP-binding protein, partial [Pseudomonadales bacterium]